MEEYGLDVLLYIILAIVTVGGGLMLHNWYVSDHPKKLVPVQPEKELAKVVKMVYKPNPTAKRMMDLQSLKNFTKMSEDLINTYRNRLTTSFIKEIAKYGMQVDVIKIDNYTLSIRELNIELSDLNYINSFKQEEIDAYLHKYDLYISKIRMEIDRVFGLYHKYVEQEIVVNKYIKALPKLRDKAFAGLVHCNHNVSYLEDDLYDRLMLATRDNYYKLFDDVTKLNGLYDSVINYKDPV